MDNSKNISDSAYSELMSEKARKLTDDIQLIMAKFHVACKDGRTTDVRVLMENVLQLLQELQDELSKSSQTSPLQADSFELFSEDIRRILQLETDDATSTLALANLKPEPAFQSHQPADFVAIQEQQSGCQGFYDYNGSTSTMHNELVHDSELSSQLDCLLDFNQDLGDFTFNESSDVKQFEHNILLPCISPPPSAFLGPICALWDCQRPAQTQNAEWCQDYCSSMHRDLAFSEGGSGKCPILRPGGIGLKDDRLFSTLIAKVNGKYVGIPECEGAAIEKSPWNASKLFDLALLEGETLREWLFFDKPRRAFESGNRKQRSLSDYNGRGWHESRKQLMKEVGGHKRSYYMDPQPPGPIEWHLFEYVMNNSDVCALYKLELKFVTEKKSPKGGKVMNDSLVDLQKKMGMLTAEGSPDSKPLKGRTTKASKGTDSESSKLN